MNDENEGHPKVSPFDVRCATACTRAGLTALLFSALAFSMLQPLVRLDALDALASYASLRFALKDTLDVIHRDQCWRNQVNSTKTLTELQEQRCVFPEDSRPTDSAAEHRTPTSETTREQRNERSAPTVDNNALVRPSGAPKLTIQTSLPHADELLRILVGLADGKLLSRARSYSNQFNLSIYRWEGLRYRLLIEEKAVGPIIYVKGDTSSDKVPNFPRQLLNKATLDDIEKLAAYEFELLSDVVGFVDKGSLLILPSIGVPLTFPSATIFVEAVVLLSVIYFWLFQQEARHSGCFPAPGTLFGVFARTTLSRRLLLLLVAIPPMASGLLAVYSFNFTYWNVPLAGIVLGFSFLISADAQSERNRWQKQES